jgi:hypothetical protein
MGVLDRECLLARNGRRHFFFQGGYIMDGGEPFLIFIDLLFIYGLNKTENFHQTFLFKGGEQDVLENRERNRDSEG